MWGLAPASLLDQEENGEGIVDRPLGSASPSTLTVSSELMEVSHRVVGNQYHWLPIWSVVGFSVSRGQQPAGRECYRNHRMPSSLNTN